jgi:hypothetical protein
MAVIAASKPRQALLHIRKKASRDNKNKYK